MPVLPPSDTVRFAVVQTLGDDLEVTNVYHIGFSTTGPYVGADLQAAAQEVATVWAAHFSPVLGGDQFLTHVVAKDLSVVDGSEATFVEPSPVQGGTGGGDMSANVSLVVSWKESLSYKGGHPRSYLAGIPRSGIADPQHVSGAYATSVQSAANAFIAGIAAGTFPVAMGSGQLAVVHYRINKVVQTPPLVKPILSATVNTRLDSQRRRLQK